MRNSLKTMFIETRVHYNKNGYNNNEYDKNNNL